MRLYKGSEMKLLISSVILLLSTAVYADTASDIEKAVLDNLEHTQNEDIEARKIADSVTFENYLPDGF